MPELTFHQLEQLAREVDPECSVFPNSREIPAGQLVLAVQLDPETGLALCEDWSLTTRRDLATLFFLVPVEYWRKLSTPVATG